MNRIRGKRVVYFIIFLLSACVPGIKQKNPLAETPPMGWNSYDFSGHLATEQDIKANADYMAVYC